MNKMQGQIVKILSNDYFVASENEIVVCKSRGKFRIDNITPRVGDFCLFDENKVIFDILPRKNTLERPNVANVDQAFIITSLTKPDFSTNLLDKLLTITNIHHIEPVICLTKKDLLTKDEYKKLKPIISYYKKYYKVVFNYNKMKIKKLLRNKLTVFTGQTGAGKSTLLNVLDKSLNFETDEISSALGRGKHTTRYVVLVDMFKGKVVDTPGFSSIDLSVYKDEEIRDSFIEFNNIKCSYTNCMHLNEKECLIKVMVKNNQILKSRYDNYKKFIEKR